MAFNFPGISEADASYSQGFLSPFQSGLQSITKSESITKSGGGGMWPLALANVGSSLLKIGRAHV